MRPFRTAAALLTCSLALSACETTRIAEPLRPDKTNPDRFVCELAGTRPTIPPEYVIDWSKVQTVEQAKGEHEAYVKAIRTREGIIAGYIVTLEGVNFTCFNNMTWQRDFYSGLPGAPRAPTSTPPR